MSYSRDIVLLNPRNVFSTFGRMLLKVILMEVTDDRFIGQNTSGGNS